MEFEQYKDIKGYEGIYKISNFGNVLSVLSNNKILKPRDNGYGYKSVCLTKDKKPRYYKIHRLVALNFIPNPENKKEVNHINGVKSDNTINNLQWVTPSENVNHSMINVLQGNLILSLNKSKCIKSLYQKGISKNQLCNLFNCSNTTMWNVLNNKIWNQI